MNITKDGLRFWRSGNKDEYVLLQSFLKQFFDCYLLGGNFTL